MQDKSATLAALIGSRICHDLISPIGAISNGLELLDLTGAAEGPEFDLIADSVGNAGAKIRFLRIAFGAASDQMLGASEIRSIVRDLWQNSRVSATWHPDQPLSRADVRLAFLAMQCCEAALPYGGQIDTRQTDTGLIVSGLGETVNCDDTLWQPLADTRPPEPVSAAAVQFALLPLHATTAGRPLTVQRGDTGVTIAY